MQLDIQLLRENAEHFRRGLQQVYAQAGRAFNWPLHPTAGWSVTSKRINPQRLFCAVLDRGGYHQVSSNKRHWWAVAQDLGIKPGLAGTLSFHIRQLYQERLLDLELQATAAAGSVSAAGNAPASISGPPLSLPPNPPPPPTTPQQPSTVLPPPTPQQTPLPSTPTSVPPALSSTPLPSTPPSEPPQYSQPSPPSEEMATPMAGAVNAAAQDAPAEIPTPGEPSVVLDYTGGDIYHRAYMGIRSELPQEVQFGLQVMLRASDVHQDALLFENYPFLMEALLRQVLKIGNIVYGVEWEPNYDYAYFDEEYKRNARFDDLCTEGTFDLLQRIRRLRVILPSDNLFDDETRARLDAVTNASLVLRNMCQVAANANFMDVVCMARDCATIVLKLPNRGIFQELKNNILEMVIEACPWWGLWPVDPLFITLLEYLGSKDRFQLLCALRALVMFSYELEGVKKFGLAKCTVLDVMNYLLLENDPELMSSTLDFVYQYVCEPDNVEFLVNNIDLPTTLIPRLVKLLLYGAERQQDLRVYQAQQQHQLSNKISIPPLNCIQDFLEFKEPDRTSRWAQCLFIEDSQGEIAQRAVWLAYQQTFTGHLKPNDSPLLAAPEFINTVTHAFKIARARVISDGEQGQKFVIQGIRPRATCRNMSGFPYLYCNWRVAKQPVSPSTSPANPDANVTTGNGLVNNYKPPTVEDEADAVPYLSYDKSIVTTHLPAYEKKARDPELEKQRSEETPAAIPQSLDLDTLTFTGHTLNDPDLEYCNRVFTDPQVFRRHVLCVHMGIRNATDGNWYPFSRFKKTPNPVCRWDNCEALKTPTWDLNHAATHVSTHLPPLRDMNDTELEWNRSFYYPKRFIAWDYFVTPCDENKEPYGIAYKALLILRNILQNAPQGKPTGRFEGSQSWGVALFYSQRARLLELADLNPTLRKEIFDFVNDIDNSRWGFVFEL
ncbi:Chromatin structure-remodeling complex protein rsc9 [Ophidiomyces ophidiicola]|nr:Chromatin structure-remodeling complex protein rsc9 [Ophidiomyces ophidiicola]